MTSLLLVLALNFRAIPRDSYGVPQIRAATLRQAWQDQGFAAAEDRMWQMELSRHLARGTLASILGRSALASDTEVAKTGYTTEELQTQFDLLSPFAKTAIEGYAEGVTRFIQLHRLPADFATADDDPKPWSVLDSVAICIRLFQEFGKGGAGELRNLAFIQYAKTQPKLKDRYLDALDDFAWQNDPAAVTTISPADDALAAHPPVIFPAFDRTTTEARLREIPVPSLFELLPAVQLAERSDSHLLAERLSTPFRTGSYCVVVSPQRSSSGVPLLLSGPQMGFTTPSILHEVSIEAPGLHVSGADVPGVPGVVVGKTDHFAWGVTSGEADTEDIVWSKMAHLVPSPKGAREDSEDVIDNPPLDSTFERRSAPRPKGAREDSEDVIDNPPLDSTFERRPAPSPKGAREDSEGLPAPAGCPGTSPADVQALKGRHTALALQNFILGLPTDAQSLMPENISHALPPVSLSLFAKMGREGWGFAKLKKSIITQPSDERKAPKEILTERTNQLYQTTLSRRHEPFAAYVHNGTPIPIDERSTQIQIKGEPPATVTSQWTEYGPVVLTSPSLGVVFSRHSAYRGQELRSFDALLSTYTKKNAKDIDRAISPATMNFNYFFATTSGDIGYRYLGLIPLRAKGLDPRLPTPDEEQYAWKGFVPPSQMPHTLNPKAGLVANWNNKPTTWWPNGDTPAWGRIHEANSLFDELTRPKFSADDLAHVVKNIAQKDYIWPFFKQLAPKFDGRLTAGSSEPQFVRWFDKLRRELIQPVTGGFLSPDVFSAVVQPTVVWNALHGKTHLDFLAGLSAQEAAAKAKIIDFGEPSAEFGGQGYSPTGPTFKNIGKMPYGNRGTYIQIVELAKTGPQGRSVLPPGEATAGQHAGDQLPLANKWKYKSMGH